MKPTSFAVAPFQVVIRIDEDFESHLFVKSIVRRP